MEHADAELNKAHRQERHAKIKIEREETKMLKLKDNYTNIKKDLENVEKKLVQQRSQISFIEKLHLDSQKAHIIIRRKIEQKIIECNTILKECTVRKFLRFLRKLKNIEDLFYFKRSALKDLLIQILNIGY